MCIARAVILVVALITSVSAQHERLEQAEVWYTPASLPVPRITLPAPSDRTLVDEHLSQLRRQYELDFERLARGPFARRMESIGLDVVYASAFAPAAVVRGDAVAIERLCGLREIVRVTPMRTYRLEQDLSRQTVRADAVARLPARIGALDGTGAKLCVLEGSIEQANPWMPPVTFFQSAATVPVSRHATTVAGVLASQHTQYRGLAPGATLLNANIATLGTNDVLAGSDWAVRQGAHCINASFGSDTAGRPGLLDNYFDHLSRHLLVNFIKGAGNQGGSSGYVVSPGLGFNSIAVGNSFDNKTPFWVDDVMNANSGYRDPATGHPKPEIVAPASVLTGLTDQSPWIGGPFGGGSFAGPQGNAVAALLMEREPLLKLWPEAVKATLLTSAWHKIQAPLIGERDGVGQLNALAADAAVRAGRVRFGNLTATSFDPQGNHDVVLSLQPFSETRAVVSWSSDPAASSPYSPNTLSMDLDLIVLDPAMQQVATTSNRTAGFEIVRFVPQRGGAWVFRLHAARFSGTVEPFGLAVSQILDSETAAITGPDRLTLGSSPVFTLRDPYHAGHAFTALASLSGGGYSSAFPFGNRSVPLVPDGLTVLSLQPGGGGFLTGYGGNLDGNGEAQLSAAVPNLAPLIGLELSQVGVVWMQGAAVPAAVSPVAQSRIVP